MPASTEPRWTGYRVAGLSVSALTVILKLLGGHVNATTVSLALLLNVLLSRLAGAACLH